MPLIPAHRLRIPVDRLRIPADRIGILPRRIQRSAPRFRWLAILASLAFLMPSGSPGQTAGGYGDYVDWKGWARVIPLEQPGIASSYDRGGGRPDYNQYEYPPGLLEENLETIAATIKGPGILYRFWMPHYTATRALAVRMFFDGETTPRIDSDSEQILGATFTYFSSPLVSTFAGGQVCYEPIPFSDSLRIETENRWNFLHYYHYSYRTFPAGTDVDSWDGTLEAEAQAARAATITMFENAGEHPAGESVSAVRTVVGAASVPGGGRLTLADLAGPGWIRRLNVRMDGATDQQLENLRLRVFWDADSLPSIDAPVGWFFGAGEDRAPYRSLVMGTDSPDGFYCYWPMPFHQAAHVELVNPLSYPVPIDSTVVEHEPGFVATNMAYLHAVARDTVQTGDMSWFVMAGTQGSGHYVGNMLFVDQDYDSQYILEGDDHVVIDGSLTLRGTGLEDAYNGGYYYNWQGGMDEPEGTSPSSAIRPLTGILRVEKTAAPPYSRADQYRWMIADRVPFTRSLLVKIESRYAEAQARWKSVVYWYQLPTGVSGGLSSAEAGERTRPPRPRLIAVSPAREAIVVRFELSTAGVASLDLLDAAGRRIATMTDGPRSAGVHEVRWSREREPSGVYFVRLRAGGAVECRKLVLLH